MREYSLPRQLARLPQLLVLPLTFLLTNAAKKAPSVVEGLYSNGLYPMIRDAVSKLTRALPFSAAETVFFGAALTLCVLFIIHAVRLFSFRRDALIRMLSFIISVAVTFAYLVSAFYLMWGLNYHRMGLAEKLDLPDREYSTEELYALCVKLTQEANAEAELVTRGGNGVFSEDFSEIRQDVQEAFGDFSKLHPSFCGDVPQVKGLASSELFSALGITGIFVFLTEEPNVNTNEPSLFLAHAAAHETAHYLGYAAEEDANFLGYLVCEASNSHALKYSAAMHALVHCMSALYKADPEAYDEISGTYGEAVLRDLKDYSAHCDKYESELRRSAQELNDGYLKANNQEKGVDSYEEDVALYLRIFDSRGLFS
ncbi:MAG: DUF3810 domain-containing protein [Clostridia bacterium]|nr:DUF3810 domain-containing protein [Clostridia bacterium]